MKRYVLIFWLLMTIFVTLAYAAIQGDFVINGVDATTSTKFYRIRASVANGLLVDVSRISGTVSVLVTNSSLTVNGTVAISTMPTITISSMPSITITSLPTITNRTGDTLLTTNSTATALASGGSYTGTFTETLGYSNITVMILSNVASATNGVRIQYSSDGTNIDYVSTREYTDNVGNGVVYTVPTRGRYVRVLYTNGGTIQTTFRLQSILRVSPSSAAIQELDTTVGNHVQALITKSSIIGKTTAGGGTYVDVKVNPSGALVADVSDSTSPYKVTNSAVITQFTGTTVSTVLSSASTTRSMMFIFNEGSSSLYVALASTAATTAYTYKLQPEAYWEMPYTTYTGTISGIWSGATATTMVTVY